MLREVGNDENVQRDKWGEVKVDEGAGLAAGWGRALAAHRAVCSTVLPEEVVTGHCESSHKHHILLEVHLPISILI